MKNGKTKYNVSKKQNTQCRNFFASKKQIHVSLTAKLTKIASEIDTCTVYRNFYTSISFFYCTLAYFFSPYLFECVPFILFPTPPYPLLLFSLPFLLLSFSIEMEDVVKRKDIQNIRTYPV